jgi:ECF sigma factor
MTEIPQERQLVTRLLREWGGGNKEALDELMPIVYQQLRKLASISLRSERPDHTLRATALVHEAYMRLVDADVAWQDRVHFFAVAARLLRRILVDHAKSSKRANADALSRMAVMTLGTNFIRNIVSLLGAPDLGFIVRRVLGRRVGFLANPLKLGAKGCPSLIRATFREIPSRCLEFICGHIPLRVLQRRLNSCGL